MNDPAAGQHGVIQAVLLVAIAAFLAHTVAQFRRGALGPVAATAWIVAWLVGGLAVVFPQGATRAANKVGVGRGADLVIYVALVALFYALFRLLLRIERTDRRLTELVRELAISERLRADAREDGGAREA
jgi:hypothetical protein